MHPNWLGKLKELLCEAPDDIEASCATFDLLAVLKEYCPVTCSNKDRIATQMHAKNCEGSPLQNLKFGFEFDCRIVIWSLFYLKYGHLASW